MEVAKTETIPSRVNHACHVPPKLTASAAYAIQTMVRDGSHTLQEFHPQMWLSLLFFQPKFTATGELRTEQAEFDDDRWGLFKQGDEIVNCCC